MLERNSIYIGDSYELIKEIPDKSIDLIVIDPPYQIDGKPKSKEALENTKKWNYKRHKQTKSRTYG